VADLNLTATVTDGAGNRTFLNTSSANDGDIATYSYRASFFSGGGTLNSYLKSDLGSEFTVTDHVVRGGYGNAGENDPVWNLWSSNDGSSWSTASHTYVWDGTGPYRTATMTLDSPTTARYWRIGDTVTGSGFKYPDIVNTWTINGDAPSGGSVTAAFSGTPTSGVATLSVQFTDSSSGTPTAWSWNFGDGSAAGTAQNPSHDYTAPGIYTVSLTASNAGGTATEVKTGYITVNSSGVVFGDSFIELPTEDIQSWVIRRSSGPAATGASYTGAATIRLINRADRYNPENASSDIIDDLRDGTRIWIGVNADGTITPDASKTVHGLFAGRITEITVIPTPGTDIPAFVEFVCEDPLSWISRAPVRLSASRHRSQRALRTEILADAGETSFDLDEEEMTMPLSYADGEAGGLLEELNRANGTRHFARPSDDPDTWYEYATVARMGNLAGVAQGTVSAGTQHVTDTSGWRTSADTVINQQRVTIEPYYFTSYSTVVWEFPDVPFPADRRTDIWVDFDDFVDDPVIDISYTGGTVTPTLTDFGTTAKVELSVSGTATINRLEVEGALARRGPAESVIIDDEASQAPPRGIRAGSEISGDYVGTITAATGLAEHIIWRYADPKYSPDMTVVNWLPTMFALDLYDNIAVTSTHIGVAARIFEIVGITHEGHRAADSGVVHHVTKYDLFESRVQTATDWFVCDTSTANGTHILGY
jgi:PKD repeat protein